MDSTRISQRKTVTYTYASQPRAVQQRGKYRDNVIKALGVPMYANLMFDRRVIRGNTLTLRHLPSTSIPDMSSREHQAELQRRILARQRAKEQLKLRSPEPVEGRKHVEIQTELYLEEISDRIEEADVECQTDPFLDRPATPFFIPAKTGLDAETQIYEGDLFDFDLEVKPILEVLVGKTVEQALLEVMEEEELENIRRRQREFLKLRNAELLEQQRLEEQERRHKEEKERRMKHHLEALEKERETAEKVASHAYTKAFFTGLVPSTVEDMVADGYFFDTVERDVEIDYLPWLMDQTIIQIDRIMLGRNILDEIICEVVRKRAKEYDTFGTHVSKEVSESEDPETDSVLDSSDV